MENLDEKLKEQIVAMCLPFAIDTFVSFADIHTRVGGKSFVSHGLDFGFCGLLTCTSHTFSVVFTDNRFLRAILTSTPFIASTIYELTAKYNPQFLKEIGFENSYDPKDIIAYGAGALFSYGAIKIIKTV